MPTTTSVSANCSPSTPVITSTQVNAVYQETPTAKLGALVDQVVSGIDSDALSHKERAEILEKLAGVADKLGGGSDKQLTVQEEAAMVSELGGIKQRLDSLSCNSEKAARTNALVDLQQMDSLRGVSQGIKSGLLDPAEAARSLREQAKQSADMDKTKGMLGSGATQAHGDVFVQGGQAQYNLAGNIYNSNVSDLHKATGGTMTVDAGTVTDVRANTTRNLLGAAGNVNTWSLGQGESSAREASQDFAALAGGYGALDQAIKSTDSKGRATLTMDEQLRLESQASGVYGQTVHHATNSENSANQDTTALGYAGSISGAVGFGYQQGRVNEAEAANLYGQAGVQMGVVDTANRLPAPEWRSVTVGAINGLSSTYAETIGRINDSNFRAPLPLLLNRLGQPV